MLRNSQNSEQNRNTTHHLRGNDSRAVRTNEPGFLLPAKGVLDPDHVLLGDALSDAYHQGDLSLNSLKDGGSGARRWDVDHGGIRLHGIAGLFGLGKRGTLLID